jgi:hypothetical protein
MQNLVSRNKKARQEAGSDTNHWIKYGGDDGDRTHDPFHAMEVLSQLSYVPLFKTNRPTQTRAAILYKTTKKTSPHHADKWWAKQDLNL